MRRTVQTDARLKSALAAALLIPRNYPMFPLADASALSTIKCIYFYLQRGMWRVERLSRSAAVLAVDVHSDSLSPCKLTNHSCHHIPKNTNIECGIGAVVRKYSILHWSSREDGAGLGFQANHRPPHSTYRPRWR